MSYIVVGGGLAGLSAAHTLIQAGQNVIMLERNLFMGGNSTKATSGMNGGGTRTQKAMGVPDTKEIFEEDMIRGATGVKTGPCPESYDLAKVVTHNSADAIHWIQDNFGLALDTVSRLGGHSQPRTHRSAAGTTFPGMEITYALMKAYEELAKAKPEQVKLVTKARVNKLMTENGRVIGCEYADASGKQIQVPGKAVIVTSGGYGAGGLFEGSLLTEVRPDLCHLPTTNGEHCTGDGISFAKTAGGGTVDLQHVQVHPTGLVHLDDKDNRVKFLAAEALRGEGGIILDKDGHRFCNDLGTRDYVSMNMWSHDKAPYRLILNETSYSNIAWHCKHYCGRRVMREMTGAELCKDMGVSEAALQSEFDTYNGYAKNDNDPWGKKFFNGVPLNVTQKYMVAQVTPVVHYTMGGLKINGECKVLHESNGKAVPGLWSAGEATGGVHGRNRLGGSALLECVALGRVAGTSAMAYGSVPYDRDAVPYDTTKHVTVPPTPSTIPPETANYKNNPPPTAPMAAAVAGAAVVAAVVEKGGEYTLAEVAKHKKASDCWVVVNGEVLDVTEFLPDHPGGKMAIMAFAGRDATEEFNMVHEEGVVQKYAGQTVIGKLKASSKL